ncbi:MFS transporter [Leptolyngbya sp. BL0902]|uniref:MFS transporter n=1 Tax=Leptolyngbya sp. BL0902 TaxID=1115757 RepID=UPI0018E8E982|nr:MFS transporter [Leptolyngbya sp. BL0902]QQE66163.1 MFS transporter [Leptolyngbya sp. BL0902]
MENNPAQPPTSTDLASTRFERWGGPIGLGLTFFMLSYTVGVVQPIMPSLVQEFQSTVGYIQSALVMMSLLTASFTPTAENLSRRLGRKWVFNGALALFALGLGLVMISQNMGLFTLGLAGGTGLAASVLVSTPVALMDRCYPDTVAKKYALLALTVAGISGALTGSILGGIMAYQLNWRWPFGIALLLIPIIARLVWPLLRYQPTRSMAVDWVGGLLSVAGFGCTLVGLSLAADLGWWVPKGIPDQRGFWLAPLGISVVPVLLAAGMICLGLLAFWERQRIRRGEESLLRMGVFNRRIYALGLTIGTLHTLLHVGVQFNLFQFIPAVMGLNPFQTAIAVAPVTIAQLGVLLTLAKRRPRQPHRWLLQWGLGIKALGILLLWWAMGPNLTLLRLMPPLVVFGLGTGIFSTYITSLTFTDTQEEEKAEARGVYRPFQNLGASLGRGVLGTILVGIASIQIVDGILAELGQTLDPAVRRQAIRSLQTAIQTLRPSDRQGIFAALPDAIQPALPSILKTAALSAMQYTLLLAFGLCLICLALSFWLPKTSKQLEAAIE